MSLEEKIEKFKEEVAGTINRLSLDAETNTPDFILANYLANCLKNFGGAVKKRGQWFNEDPK